MIGVVVQQIVRDGVNDTLRNLAASGTVEVDRGLSIDLSRKGGKLLATIGKAEAGHGYSRTHRGEQGTASYLVVKCRRGQPSGPGACPMKKGTGARLGVAAEYVGESFS